MKYTEIAQKSVAELQAMLKEKKLEVLLTRQKIKLGQSNQTHVIRNARKAIARINTAITAKQQQGE